MQSNVHLTILSNKFVKISWKRNTDLYIINLTLPG